MRELKFRAYNRKTKNMWWFDLMWGNTYSQGSGWIGMLPIGETKEHSGGINGSDNRTQVDPTDCEIMQFTGLKDKNGEEIYEGYIVKQMDIDWDNTPDDAEPNKYVMREIMRDVATMERFPSFWLKNENFGYEGEELIHPEDCEIIGNIYENPELLQEAK